MKNLSILVLLLFLFSKCTQELNDPSLFEEDKVLKSHQDSDWEKIQSQMIEKLYRYNQLVESGNQPNFSKKFGEIIYDDPIYYSRSNKSNYIIYPIKSKNGKVKSVLISFLQNDTESSKSFILDKSYLNNKRLGLDETLKRNFSIFLDYYNEKYQKEKNGGSLPEGCYEVVHCDCGDNTWALDEIPCPAGGGGSNPIEIDDPYDLDPFYPYNGATFEIDYDPGSSGVSFDGLLDRLDKTSYLRQNGINMEESAFLYDHIWPELLLLDHPWPEDVTSVPDCIGCSAGESAVVILDHTKAREELLPCAINELESYSPFSNSSLNQAISNNFGGSHSPTIASALKLILKYIRLFSVGTDYMAQDLGGMCSTTTNAWAIPGHIADVRLCRPNYWNRTSAERQRILLHEWMHLYYVADDIAYKWETERYNGLSTFQQFFNADSFANFVDDVCGE